MVVRASPWVCAPAIGVALASIVGACAHASKTGGAPASWTAAKQDAAAAGSGLHFDIGAIDPRADPCKDFYDYACGGWRASHPIPPDQTRWYRYAELVEANHARERAIVEGALGAGPNATTPAEKRIGAVYGACMDEAAVEARGIAPLSSILARIDAARTPEAAMNVVAELLAHNIPALIDAVAWTDPHDAHKMVLTLDHGFLGMQAGDDYTSADPRAAKMRASYREHLVRLFRVLEPSGDASAEADRVVAIETSLAPRKLSPVEERDPDAQYHPMTAAELRDRYPALDLPRVLVEMGAPSFDRAIVAVPPWLEGVNASIASGDLAPVRAYLRAVLLRHMAPALPGAFERERFEFEQRTVSGASEMKPRWRRCIDLVDATVGEDVGRIFLARYFDGEARARMDKMIGALRTAYAEEIRTSDWLGPATRAAALAKLSNLLIVAGGSNRLRDLDGLAVDRADLFGDVWRANALRMQYALGRLAHPTDREEFFDALPQSLDGFETHEMLGVGFTAGFLQPPVFDPAMDDAVNFGGLGGVIGHELSHEFDDEGRKFDAEGNLRPWWSPGDIARYEARAQCFVEEYGKFHTEHGTPLDGKLTLGENLGDNGGLRVSYQALRPSDAGPKVDGFTPAQRFFLAWGQIRCENVTPKAEERQAKNDGHSAGRWRVNGVVRNMPEFARAFACRRGAEMAPETRCRLW